MGIEEKEVGSSLAGMVRLYDDRRWWMACRHRFGSESFGRVIPLQ